MGKKPKETTTRRLAIWGFAMAAVSFPLSIFISSVEIYDRWAFRPRLSMQITGVWNYAERGQVPMLMAHCLVTNKGNRKMALTKHAVEWRKSRDAVPSGLSSMPVNLDDHLMPEFTDKDIIPGSLDAGESKKFHFVILAGDWLKKLDIQRAGFRLTLYTDHGDFRSDWHVGVVNNLIDVFRFNPDTVPLPLQMDSFENPMGR